MKKIKVDNIFYYLAYALILTSLMCSQFLIIANNKKVIYLLAILLLIIHVISKNQKYSIKSIVLFVMSLFTLIVSLFINNSYILLLSLIFIFCFRNMNVNDFIKFDLKLKIFLMIMIVLSWIIGIIPEVTMTRIDGTIRHSLGFSHPNSLGLYLFCISSEIVYLYHEKLKIKHYLLIIFCLLISNNICDSRSATLSIILLCTLFFLKKINILKINKITIYLPLFFTVFSLGLSLLFLNNPNNDFLISINDIMSGRLRCASEFLEYYGLNLFGHNFEYYGLWNIYGQRLTVLDNSYVYLFIHYGLLSGLLMISMVATFWKKLLLKKDYFKICYLIAFLFFGLMENVFFIVFYNVILISMFEFESTNNEIINN